jgi:hypothetical protein
VAIRVGPMGWYAYRVVYIELIVLVKYGKSCKFIAVL